MSNFNDYIKNNESNFSSSDDKPSNEHLEDFISRYQNLSSSELMNEFMKLTIEKKRKGELRHDELNSIKETISPYLNDEQNSNLEKLMKMVNDV